MVMGVDSRSSCCGSNPSTGQIYTLYCCKNCNVFKKTEKEAEWPMPKGQ